MAARRIASESMNPWLPSVKISYPSPTAARKSPEQTAQLKKSINTVIEEIVRSMEFKGEIVYDTTKSDGQYKKTANNAKLAALYKEKTGRELTFTPFKQAIAASCKWFEENFDVARK